MRRCKTIIIIIFIVCLRGYNLLGHWLKILALLRYVPFILVLIGESYFVVYYKLFEASESYVHASLLYGFAGYLPHYKIKP